MSILPTSRGGYVIGTFDTFCEFNKDEIEITPIEFPSILESLNHNDITSEATAINCAFVSNILQDFTGEENLYPTVSGRMSSSEFQFRINDNRGIFNVNVCNSQVEIDGGYEGDDSLNLIEAKNYLSDDFLVRQLYYPYKLWSSKVHKKVRPIYMTYSNGIFHLREYEFVNPELYNSINLVKQKKYVIQEGSFNIEVLTQIIDNTNIVKEPEIPFPQADSFERVVNLCELIKDKGVVLPTEITQKYDFVPRQAHYYSTAGRYLGLIENKTKEYSLTSLGKNLFNKSIIERQKEFVRLILAHSVFKQTLQLCLENAEMPKIKQIVEIMKSSELYDVGSEKTFQRRASTVAGWVNWIIAQIRE